MIQLNQHIIYGQESQMRYVIDRLKLQTADTKAWIIQIIIIAVVLGAYWVPRLLEVAQ